MGFASVDSDSEMDVGTLAHRRTEEPDDYLGRGGARLGRAFLRLSLGVSGILALDVLASVAVAIVLARNLGVTGLGLYSIGIAAGRILTPVVQLGLPVLLAREFARAEALGDRHTLGGLVRFAAATLAALTAGFAVLCVIAWPLIDRAVPEAVRAVLLPGLLLTPLAALVSVAGGVLQGFRRVAASAVATTLAQNATMLGLALTAIAFAPGWLTPGRAVWLNAAAVAATLAGAAAFLLPRLAGAWRCARPVYRTRAWMQSAVRFAMAGGLVTAEQHALILVLGVAANEAQATFFRIAQRTASLANLGYATVIRVVGPGISESHARGDIARLRAILSQGARGMAATTLLVLVLLAVAGEWMLGLAFGADFLPAYQPLMLLCAAWSLRAFFGPVEPLMEMTGNEGAVLRARLLGLAVMVTGAAALAPSLGALGAAAAAGLGHAALALSLWRASRQRFGCVPSAFGR